MATDVDDCLSEMLEDRADSLEHVRLPTDHDRQGAVDRSLFATAHRGVQDSCASLCPGVRHSDRGLRGNRAHVYEQQVITGGVEDSARRQHDLLDLRGVGQHRDDHLCTGHCLLDASRGLAGSLEQPVRGGR